MISISNSLSFARAPLALLFLFENTSLRLLAIFLAMFTDSIDGYIARRSKSTSKFGAVLDPLMDKFFVFFLLGVFLIEGKISILETSEMLARDFLLCAFGIYLAASRRWSTHRFASVRWSKITTALQFIALILITIGFKLSPYLFLIFVFTGTLAFFEFLQIKPSKTE